MDEQEFQELVSAFMERTLDNSTLQEIVESAAVAKAAVDKEVRSRQSVTRLLELVGMVVDAHRDALLKKVQEHGLPSGIPEVM